MKNTESKDVTKSLEDEDVKKVSGGTSKSGSKRSLWSRVKEFFDPSAAAKAMYGAPIPKLPHTKRDENVDQYNEVDSARSKEE